MTDLAYHASTTIAAAITAGLTVTAIAWWWRRR